jgi:catechol 2,3-dioxygenase-like lactoylglutathione lyase family enzyme
MELHHLALRTPDIEALVRFYRGLFRLPVVRERPGSVWLGLSDRAVLMIEARGPDEPPVPRGSLELIAFRVDDAEKERVRRQAQVAGCYDGETPHSVYVRDPDGRRVGVSTYPFAIL